MRNPLKKDTKDDSQKFLDTLPKAALFGTKAEPPEKVLKVVKHVPGEESVSVTERKGSVKQKTNKGDHETMLKLSANKFADQLPKLSTLQKQNKEAAISEVSDVENITAASKLFRFQLNLDNLKEVLEEMRF